MEVGIFAKTFPCPTIEETLDAVAAHGLRHVQLNLACAGLPSMPDQIDPVVVDRVSAAAAARGIGIAAVSGTFNMIHPDPHHREAGLRRLRALAAACPRLGTSLITLCTGTRDREDMWRRHPANDAPAAWRDLLASMSTALAIAEEADLTLAFEPERANVVNTAARGRRLLRELAGPCLGVVIDPANLIDPGDQDRLPEILVDAFDLLGDRVVLAHAKDRGPVGEVRPAGEGIVPWRRYVDLLRATGYNGPLILHGLDEARVGAAVGFLRATLGTSAGEAACNDAVRAVGRDTAARPDDAESGPVRLGQGLGGTSIGRGHGETGVPRSRRKH